MNIIKSGEMDFNAVREAMLALEKKYPFLNRKLLGKSVLGKEIFALTLGDSDHYILYAGAFHGMERITTVLLLMFLERLCEALQNGDELAGLSARRAFFGRSLAVVPVVNPDGCDISLKGLPGAGAFAAGVFRMSGGELSRWNANARGVDINHNFDAGHDILRKMERDSGITGPGPTRYGGERPESEPETAALTKFCRENFIERVIAFHSQGEEIYYKYGTESGKQPPMAETLAKIFAYSSGYELSEPETIASHGGFKDWFVKEFFRPGFTFEIGKGVNPLPPEQVIRIYDRLERALMLGITI